MGCTTIFGFYLKKTPHRLGCVHKNKKQKSKGNPTREFLLSPSLTLSVGNFIGFFWWWYRMPFWNCSIEMDTPFFFFLFRTFILKNLEKSLLMHIIFIGNLSDWEWKSRCWLTHSHVLLCGSCRFVNWKDKNLRDNLRSFRFGGVSLFAMISSTCSADWLSKPPLNRFRV